MQNTARNLLHVDCTTVHHHCTTVQKVKGANLNICTAPHHTPFRGWCSGAKVQRRGAGQGKANARFFAERTGRDATGANVRFSARLLEGAGNYRKTQGLKISEARC